MRIKVTLKCAVNEIKNESGIFSVWLFYIYIVYKLESRINLYQVEIFMPNWSDPNQNANAEFMLRVAAEAEKLNVKSKQKVRDIPSHIPEEELGLHLSLIREEFSELVEASGCVSDGNGQWKKTTDTDMVETADALGDLLYVVYGMCNALGMDIGECYREIQRSNMTKFRDGYKVNEIGKLIKSPKWEHPRLAEILKNQGMK